MQPAGAWLYPAGMKNTSHIDQPKKVRVRAVVRRLLCAVDHAIVAANDAKAARDELLAAAPDYKRNERRRRA